MIDRSGPRVGLLLGEGIGQVAGELAPTLPLDPGVIATIPDSGEEADAPAVLAAMHTLLERGARIVVVALAGGPGLARRELAVRGLIATDYPRHYLGAVPILPSHQVTFAPEPVIRVQSAVLDAYLHPVMSRFLYRVEDELRSSGFPHPMLVANADGGTSRVAKTTALRTWGSGPAGGVAAVAEMVRRLGLERAVGVDIGGTSADISVVHGGRLGLCGPADDRGRHRLASGPRGRVGRSGRWVDRPRSRRRVERGARQRGSAIRAPQPSPSAATARR